ncbi:Organic cation transporter, partial [Caligus rogercresseyi]
SMTSSSTTGNRQLSKVDVPPLRHSLPHNLHAAHGWVFVGADLPHECSNSTIPEISYNTTIIGDSVVKEWDLGQGQLCSYVWIPLREFHLWNPFRQNGRKFTFLVSALGLFLSGCFAAIAPEYYSFLIARVVIGIAIPGVETACFVMGMELVGPSKRTLAGILCWFFESGGLLLTVALAYFLNSNWRLLQAVYSLPLILFVPYIWFTPESPRWLISRKRYEDAEKTISKIMTSNGVKDSGGENLKAILKNISDLESKQESTQEHYSYLDLWRYPGLRVKTFILNWLWIVTSSLYYVLLLDQKELSDNPYIGFLITSLIAMLTLTGISLTSLPFLESFPTARIGVSIIGRFAANCSYTILTLYSTEQYPTVVRSIGISCSLTVSRIGSILAPYVLLIGDFAFLIFGLGAILGGETLGRHLPETIEESEKIKIHLPCQNVYAAPQDEEEENPVYS